MLKSFTSAFTSLSLDRANSINSISQVLAIDWTNQNMIYFLYFLYFLFHFLLQLFHFWLIIRNVIKKKKVPFFADFDVHCQLRPAFTHFRLHFLFPFYQLIH